MKALAVYAKTPEALDPAACFAKAAALGFHGVCAPLSACRKSMEARRVALSEVLEEHPGMTVPVLASDLDLIRNHQEDTRRAMDEISWMNAQGFPDLVLTLTQGARSYQIEDQEYLMVQRSLKRIAEEAHAKGVRLSLRVTPRHVADSLSSADRVLKESRDSTVLVSIDLQGMAGEGHLDGAVAVRYFAPRLGFVELDATYPEAEAFHAWLAAQPPALFPREVHYLIRDSAEAASPGTKLCHALFGAPQKGGKKPSEERRENRGEGRKKAPEMYPF